MTEIATSYTDHLQIYGFSFDFPGTSRVEFHPKFERESGDLAVKSSTKSVVRVTWGPIEKVKNTLPTAERHADFGLEQIKRGIRGSMTSIEHRRVAFNGHDSVYNCVRVEAQGKGLFAKGTPKKVVSLHAHCPKTSRYFIIYGESDPTNSTEQERTILQIASSFRCH